MQWIDALGLLAACFAGGLIGLERELHDKPAGFRTNIMICLGAALFTILSIRISEQYPFAATAGPQQRIADPTRIAAQIVTGVGFLGAGAIIQARGGVRGLTTAATIWTVASVGMAFGAGHFGLGFAATLLAAGILFGLASTEDLIANWYTTLRIEIVTDPSPEAADKVETFLRQSGVRCRSLKITKSADGFAFFVALRGPEDKLERLQRELILEKHVLTLRQV